MCSVALQVCGCASLQGDANLFDDSMVATMSWCLHAGAGDFLGSTVNLLSSARLSLRRWLQLSKAHGASWSCVCRWRCKLQSSWRNESLCS
jgi:hypothetical protein